MFVKGQPIKSLDELMRQEFVFYHHKVTHAGWFSSWQLGWAKRNIEQSNIYYAIKKENNHETCNRD